MQSVSIDDLKQFVAHYVADEPARSKIAAFWEEPIVSSAVIDERFDRLPEIAMAEHLHPCDLLADARSVVVFFIPFTEALIKENRPGDRPCRNWGVAYVQTNDLINRIGRALADWLKKKGYRCGLTPATHNFDEAQLMARWSHKHLAYLCGMGRFGTHHLLITPKGCAGRMGSLVTDAPLGDHPLMSAQEACLLKAGRECGKCIQRCPVDALSAHAFKRRACWDRLKQNLAQLDEFKDLPDSTHVCGKCAAMVPCSFGNPLNQTRPAGLV